MKQVKNPTENTSFHPKIQSQFKVTIEKPFDVPIYVCYSATRPIWNNTEKWSSVILKFYDPIEPSTTEKLVRGIEKTNQIKFKIEGLGPVGDVVESWVIDGKVTSIDFGEFNWKTKDNHVSVEMEVDVETCILEF